MKPSRPLRSLLAEGARFGRRDLDPTRSRMARLSERAD